MEPTLAELAEDTAVYLLPRPTFETIERDGYVFIAGTFTGWLHRVRLGDVEAAVAWSRAQGRSRGLRDLEWWLCWSAPPADAPVGGGAGLVSVSHSHHDYPAADIAAPENSPVYALSDAVVVKAWHLPDPRCGIGMTVRTLDGLVWTYCHLAYLEPGVVDGVPLSAGTSVGLVGHTGDASGPHLHLQLHPATSYPQDEGWFQSFAGTAFTWQDTAPAGHAGATVGDLAQSPGAVFSAGATAAAAPSGPVIAFTR